VAIVADKVDRVQRSFQEYPILDPMIKEGKIELHFNTEGYIIHKDSISQERLMWSIGVVMAQSYVDSMRDNINRSIAQKLRSGEWITNRLATAETHSKTYQNGSTGSWTYLAIYNPEKPEKKMWVREEDVIAQAEEALATLRISDTESLVAVLNYIRSTNAEKKIFHCGQTASLRKEHTEIEEKLDKLLDLLMDKVLDKAEFEAKKKKLKDRQYEIDGLIRSFDEADDKFSNCLIDLINIATGALDDFKGSDVTAKGELLNFVFGYAALRVRTFH
jgi:hypothetical protein